MTKAELIQDIVDATGIEKKDVSSTVEAFIGNVKSTMISGENVYLRGFGSFVIKKRAKKLARNITKNTTLMIPAHNVPSFKPAKVFLNKVKTNQKKRK